MVLDGKDWIPISNRIHLINFHRDETKLSASETIYIMKKTRRKRRKSHKKKIFLIVLLVIIIGGVAGLAVVNSKKEKPVRVTAEKTERRDITSIVSATGKIYPEVEVKISSEVPGEIIELPVEEGQKVKKGDLLTRVKPDTFEAQLKQREAAINAAKARSLQNKAELLQAELDLKRIDKLHEKGFTTLDELEKAKTRVEVYQAAFDSSLYTIKQQEMYLDEAREMLDKTVTYAPMDGTISRLSSELNERVVGTGTYQGTEIMRIADLENMEVRIEVSENEIVNVKIGDKVTITIDALPEEEFIGHVSEIASSAVTTGARSQEEVTTFEVKIKITALNPAIRPGMTATADIETKTVENVVSVPIQAVTVREKKVVYKALDIREEEDDEKEPEEKSDLMAEIDAEIEESASADKDTSALLETESDDSSEIATNSNEVDEVTDKKVKKKKSRKKTNQKNGRSKENLQRLVFVIDNQKAKMRMVETGISDNTYIEIKKGLAEGEEIITGSYSAIVRELDHDRLIKVLKKEDDDEDDKS